MDLVCFSHLRWDFVFQRPQHVLTRFARERRVFYIEEPIYADSPAHIELQSPMAKRRHRQLRRITASAAGHAMSKESKNNRICAENIPRDTSGYLPALYLYLCYRLNDLVQMISFK